jgi:hypothetical protein
MCGINYSDKEMKESNATVRTEGDRFKHNNLIEKHERAEPLGSV